MRLVAIASTLLLIVASLANAQVTGGGNTNTGGGNVAAAGGGTGAAGGNAAESVNQSNAATGLTGSRETALQTEGFLGSNVLDGQGFLGGEATGNAGRNQFGNAGNFGGRGGTTGGRQPQQQQQSSRQIRIKLVIPPDFGVVEIPPREIQTRLSSQFRKVSQLKSLTIKGGQSISTSGLRGSNVSASSNINGVVTLTGRVSNSRERIIAEKMAKMEPGVRSVVNQLVVSP